jgi:glycosyltransferase involved in cell wall biosynthesis
MKVLLAPHSWWPEIGGVAWACSQIARILVERGHQVLVMVPFPRQPMAAPRAENAPAPVVRVPRLDAIHVPTAPFDMLQHGAKAVRAIVECLRASRPDVVHINHGTYWSSAALSGAARDAMIPCVVSLRAARSFRGDGSPLSAAIAKRVIADAVRVTAVSSAIGDEAYREGFCDSRPRTVYNGVTVAATEPAVASNEGPLTYVSVGRFVPQKGFDDLLRAFRIVRDATIPARLILVGDGGHRGACETLAKRLHISRFVTFTGARPHDGVLRTLGECDVFVLATHEEGLPNVILEAMAAAKPVVATNVDGAPEAVVDGVTGLLVPPMSPPALAHAMVRLARQPALRRAMGEAGLARVRLQFTWDTMADGYLEVYNEAMAAVGRRNTRRATLDALATAPDPELIRWLLGQLRSNDGAVCELRNKVLRLLELPGPYDVDALPWRKARQLSMRIAAQGSSRMRAASDHLLLSERLLHARERVAALHLLARGIVRCPWHCPTWAFVARRVGSKVGWR